MTNSARPLPCHCGHGRSVHEHYRPGTDCALCDCPTYSTDPPPGDYPAGAARARAALHQNRTPA